ncbi:MAG: hypothetical protein Kow00108_20090 [Calditrichia bacterium]
MNWKGPVTGGLAGVILTGNPVGIVIGAAAGYVVGEKLINKKLSFFSSQKEMDAVSYLISGLFISSGKRFNWNASVNDHLIRYWKFSPNEIKSLKQTIRKKFDSTNTDIISDALKYLSATIEHSEKREKLAAMMCLMANEMMPISKSSRSLLVKVFQWLELPENSIERYLNKFSAKTLAHYRTLQSSPFQKYEDIKKGYHKMVKELHPDISTPEEQAKNNRILKTVNESWNIIKRIHLS